MVPPKEIYAPYQVTDNSSRAVTSARDLPHARCPPKLNYISNSVNNNVASSAIAEQKIQYTCSLTDACRLLSLQKYKALVVVPDELDPKDKMHLATLRNLTGDDYVLVLSGAPAFSSLAAALSTSVQIMARETDAVLYPGIGSAPDQVVAVGPIVGYRASGMITVHGKPLQVSPTLWRILWRLLDAPQKRRNCAELIETMRNPSSKNAAQTLRVHVHRLRQKLAELGVSGVLFSGRGGYWLNWEPTAVDSAIVR